MKMASNLLATWFLTLSVLRVSLADTSNCPCFSEEDLKYLIEPPNDDPFPFDVKKATSCTWRSNELVLDYAPVDLSVWNTDIQNFDHKSDYKRCSISRSKLSCQGPSSNFKGLSQDQVDACTNLLNDACNTIRQAVCPCYSYVDLTTVLKKISSGSIIVDLEQTCKKNEESFYGIFELSDHDSQGVFCENKCSNLNYAFLDSSIFPSCMAGTESGYPMRLRRSLRPILSTNPDQGAHCASMMNELCNTFVSDDFTTTSSFSCEDDVNFRLNGKQGRDCAWVDSVVGKRLKRCKRRDGLTNSFVFEHCRKTCRTCSCSNDAYLFNAQQDHDCGWVGEDPDNRCQLYGVETNCLDTCNKKCCNDDEEHLKTFTRKGMNLDEMMKDDQLRFYLCSRKNIARKFPMSCGLCLENGSKVKDEIQGEDFNEEERSLLNLAAAVFQHTLLSTEDD